MASREYPEISAKAVILGIIIGIIMIGSFTYASLILGFSIVGSGIAAIIGWGVLRGLLPAISRGKIKGTVLENNINQTIASAINVAHSGLVFTIPALFIMKDIQLTTKELIIIPVVAAIGAILGVLFIAPVRKQMIDIDRLRFPTGTAVAAILKAPGAGITKASLLMIGALISALFYLLTQLKLFGLPWSLPEVVHLREVFGLTKLIPAYIDTSFALSLLSFGAGFITGRAGLMVMAGGFLAYWIIAPLSVKFGWVPSSLANSEIAKYVHENINRPLGIGMLVGGALAGIVMTIPIIKAAIKSMLASSKLSKTQSSSQNSSQSSEDELITSDEIPFNWITFGSLISIIIMIIAIGLLGGLNPINLLLVIAFGIFWMWLAGIIVSQVTGMTDWSPISGMSLLAVAAVLYLSGKNILISVIIGAMVCVAISLASDMMQDLKTGHLVGSKPVKQQIAELATTWIGPLFAFAVLLLIAKVYGIGTEKVPAPQAVALKGVIDTIVGGNVPIVKYTLGALIGGALSATGIPGLGVLIGISMYLPITYILPYSLGCIANVIVSKVKGAKFVEEWGVPFAAGLVVGEAMVTLVIALYKLVQGLGV